jgi:hypothetical protein
LGFGMLALSGLPTALAHGAYALLIARQRCMPIWTGWLGGVATLAHLLISASFMNRGAFLSVQGSVIVWVPLTLFGWMLAISLVLLRERD